QGAVFAFLGARDWTPQTLEVIRGALRDRSTDVRYDASRVLARALRDKAGEDVIDVLEAMLHDKSLRIYRRTDASSRGSSESSSGGSTVQPVIGGDGRYLAADSLAEIGRPGNRAKIVTTLREMTKSDDENIRKSAVKALKEIGE